MSGAVMPVLNAQFCRYLSKAMTIMAFSSDAEVLDLWWGLFRDEK